MIERSAASHACRSIRVHYSTCGFLGLTIFYIKGHAETKERGCQVTPPRTLGLGPDELVSLILH
jgi:hypothetical protein